MDSWTEEFHKFIYQAFYNIFIAYCSSFWELIRRRNAI